MFNDMNWLCCSLLISGIGAVLFMYGKRQTRLPHMLAGIVFCVYPYLVANVWMMFIIAFLLGVILWAVVQMGW